MSEIEKATQGLRYCGIAALVMDLPNEAQSCSIQTDFTESAYINALIMIKATPSETIIVVGPACYDDAATLAQKYGARCVFVPTGFMEQDQWLVIGRDASAWSEGA